jgi:hypothetical protein
MSCPSNCPLLCCNNSISNIGSCNLGECAADENLDLKLCGFKHDEFTSFSDQNIVDITKQKNEDETPYFKFPNSRFEIYTMLQDILFDTITILDIQIEIELLAYHGSNRFAQMFNNVLKIPKLKGTQDIFPLMSPIYFSVYLAYICDIELAKKRDYTAADFLRDPFNLNRIELKNNVKILEKYTMQISCQEECPFSSHRMAMCIKFDKNTKMCILNRNATGEDIFFNRGKFVLFTVINYLDTFFDIKRNSPGATDPYLFGDDFNTTNGSVGHSVFFKKFNIQTAYKPEVQMIPPNKLAQIYRAAIQQQDMDTE